MFCTKGCTKTAGKALVCFGAVKCSVTCLVGFSSTCWICVPWWTVFSTEWNGWVKEIVYSSVPRLANNYFYLYCWCCLDRIFNILWENNATRKSQLRSCVESFLLCGIDAPLKFWFTPLQVSIQTLLVFFCPHFPQCLSCLYQEGLQFSHWLVLEDSAISWWSSLVTLLGVALWVGQTQTIFYLNFPRRWGPNKLEFREILYYLPILVQKLNCGK